MAISKQQSMRPAEIELIDASNQHESTLQEHAQSLETLGENLSTETTDRESADTALGTRIDDETQARTDADNALGTRIDNEVQARTDADTALGTRIDNEVQSRTDADTALGTRIDDETQARTDADTALRDSVAHVYQPSRPEKKDLLSVDLSDKNAPANQPHAVMADDVSTLSSAPPGITSGALYGLWDCDVLKVYEDGHAQILVTFREMVPVSGRVWTNWFNWASWDGWKSVTPM